MIRINTGDDFCQSSIRFQRILLPNDGKYLLRHKKNCTFIPTYCSLWSFGELIFKALVYCTPRNVILNLT